jgi:CheY-like chemotaxis protein
MESDPAAAALKPKVLLIEDNGVNAQLLRAMLEGSFEVVHAVDGHTGIIAAGNTPGLKAILLDRIMPDMDGLDALKHIKLSSKSWNIPVIMLTAALSPKQIQEAKVVGAYACLPKPYNKEKIIAAINEALKKPIKA